MGGRGWHGGLDPARHRGKVQWEQREPPRLFKPSWERERSSLAADARASTRRELFTIKDLNFAFYAARSAGPFVRQRDDGAKEATVRIESASGQMKRELMVRAQCRDELFHFGPVSADALPLKAVDEGTVGEMLFKQLCG